MENNPQPNIKRVYRSRTNQVFTGVLGGLGDYFELDPVIVRILFILVTVFTGFALGVIAYLLMMAIIPRQQV